MADKIELPDNIFGGGDQAPDNQADQNVDNSSGGQAPQTFEIEGETYTQDQLNELVKIGKMGKEADEKYNTSIDKIWPDYTKKSQRLKELENEIETIKSNTANRPALPENEEQAIKEARDAARKLGLVTDDQFEQLLQNSFRKYFVQEMAAKEMIDTGRQLEKEYNGSDGRPKFKLEEMLSWMDENGVTDLNTAYKIRYEKELDAWKEQQIGKNKKGGIVTETASSAGNKKPEEVKVNKGNLRDLLRESLEGK